MLFDNWSRLLRAALLAVLTYGWLVLMLRLYGKRTLAKLNAFDFIVTVALGSILASTILAKSTTWSQGAIALAILCRCSGWLPGHRCAGRGFSSSPVPPRGCC